MSKKKQQQTCAICLEDIPIEKEVRLDCCEHRYCGQCITTWVETQASTCPQCKEKVHTLIAKDVLGRDVETSVEEKILEADIGFDCTKCNQRISDNDFSGDEADVCDRCLDCAIHVRCMTEEQKQDYRVDDYWLCESCDREIEEMYGSECDCPNCQERIDGRR